MYRFISCWLVYRRTGEWYRFFSQFFDLDFLRAIYISHKLKRDQISDLQSWFQKLEAIFESSPQAVLQIGY